MCGLSRGLSSIHSLGGGGGAFGDQRGVVLGPLLSATGVCGAGGGVAPAIPVTSAAPVACASVVTDPGGLAPAGAAFATASPSQRVRTREFSCLDRRHRWSSGKRRSRSASASAASSSESLASEEKVSAAPPPPFSWLGAGGGRSESARSASGCSRSPRPGPSGLGSGEWAALRADRSHSEFYSPSSPAPSGAAEGDRDSLSSSVDLDWDDSFRSVLRLIREFQGVEELAIVAPNRCKISLVPIYGLQSESSPALHLPLSPLLGSLLKDTNLALAEFVKDQTVHGFLCSRSSTSEVLLDLLLLFPWSVYRPARCGPDHPGQGE